MVEGSVWVGYEDDKIIPEDILHVQISAGTVPFLRNRARVLHEDLGDECHDAFRLYI